MPLRPRIRPTPRVRLLLVGIGAGLTIALGTGLALRAAGVTIGRGDDANPRLTAPPWQEGAAQCRPNPMAHVHDPTRLIVVAKCSTVSGTVQSVHLNPDDGTLNVLVTLDPLYQRFLTAANQGVMTVGVIPTDQPAVQPPKPGQHATFYGAWVVQRVGHGVGAAALHPCWQIDVSGSAAATTSGSDTQKVGPSPSPRPLPYVDPNQSLTVKVVAPESVRLGSLMAVSISVASVLDGPPKPAQSVALYIEVVADQGRLVQWKAATTNSLGVANFKLIAAGPPDSYALWVYAHRGIQGGIGRVRFTVLPA
jgi:hypothetical protein